MSLFPVVILAAGTSHRMGERKPFIKFPSGEILLEHLVNSYRLCDMSEIIVVLNDDGYKYLNENYNYLKNKIKIVINPHPEKGRFFSIKKAVENITDSPFFLHNVDNPFVNSKLIDEMTVLLKSNSYVTPVFQGKGGHPVLLSNEITKYIKAIEANDVDFRLILSSFYRVKYEAPSVETCINLNTPDDLLKYYIHYK
jgi:CTP:molybdopterin cytidylyltransferase MocA